MIREELVAAVRQAVAESGLPEPRDVRLDVPQVRDHGDFATNVALQLAKPAGKPPLVVAEQLAAALGAAGIPHVARV